MNSLFPELEKASSSDLFPELSATPEMPLENKSSKLFPELGDVAHATRTIHEGIVKASTSIARSVSAPVDEVIMAMDEIISKALPALPPGVVGGVVGAVGELAARKLVPKPFQRTVKGLVSGGLSTLSGGAGVARAFGLEKTGKFISEVSEEASRNLLPPEPEITDKLAAAFGSTGSFLIPGLGVGTGVAKVAVAAPRLAQFLGVATSSVMEASVEGGAAYNEVMGKTGDRNEAMLAGNRVFWANVPLVYFTNKVGLLSPEAKTVARSLESALIEGTQEFSQQVIGNFATKDPILRGALEAFAMGAAVGGTLGGVGALIAPPALPAPAITPTEAELGPQMTAPPPGMLPPAASPKTPEVTAPTPQEPPLAPAAAVVPEAPPPQVVAPTPLAQEAVVPPPLVAPEPAPIIEEADSIEPEGDFDVSFEAGEQVLIPKAGTAITDMTPEEFKQAFPKAAPEIHSAAVVSAVASGAQVPHEIIEAYPEALGTIEPGGKEKALTPIIDEIRKLGGINIEKAKLMGQIGELEDARRFNLLRRNGGLSIDNLAESLHAAKLIREADPDLVIEAIKSESRSKVFGAMLSDGARAEAQIALGLDFEKTISRAARDIEGSEKRFDPSGITRELESRGFVDYRGRRIRNIRDLAEIVATFRHPKIEHFQAVYLKEGRVVAHQVVSSGIPNAVEISLRFRERIRSAISRLGADEVYIAHNHPSGEPSPSDEDMKTTVEMAQRIPELRGHVITDGKRFYFLPTGESTARAGAYEYKSGPKVDYREGLADIVTNPEEAVAALSKESRSGGYDILFLDGRNRVLAVEHIGGGAKVSAFASQQMRRYGAAQIVVGLPAKDLDSIPRKSLPAETLDIVAYRESPTVHEPRIYSMRDAGRLGRYLASAATAKGGFKGPEGAYRIREETRPYESQLKAFHQADLKAGAEVTLRRAIAAPQKLTRGTKGKIIDLDLEGGRYLVDFGGTYAVVGPMQLSESYAPLAKERPSETKRNIAEAAGLAPGPTREMAEMDLLRLKLGSEARGARIAARETARKVRAQLLADFRSRAKSLADLKKGVADYARERLPLHSRGKFLSMVAGAKTERDAARALLRIDGELGVVYRKGLVGDVAKIVSRAVNSEAVSVDYKERIKSLVAAIEMKGHSEATLASLRATQEFIRMEEAEGRDVEMPSELVDKLKILARQPIEEVSDHELERIYGDVLGMVALGKAKVRVRKGLWKLTRERIASEVVAGAKPIEKNEKFVRLPGERLAVDKQVANYVSNAMDFFNRIDLAILPMDVVFDMIDGALGYTGPNYVHFKKRLDADFWRYFDEVDARVRPVQELAQKSGLGRVNFERIGIHAVRVQEGGREHLQGLGLTDSQIDSVVLSDRENQLYLAMRSAIEAPYPRIRRIVSELYNRDIGKVENYFPFQTDWQAMSDAEVFQRLGDQFDAFGPKRRKTEQGFTVERVGGSTPAKVDAMEIFERHMHDVAYLLEMQSDLKMLSEIAASPEYRKAAGEVGSLHVQQWLDLMARRGGVAGQTRYAALDVLRRNYGAAVMGLKLSSIFIQPTALADGAAMIGGDYVLQGMNRVASSREWRDFLIKNFPELRHRVADDIAFSELSFNKDLEAVQRKGFFFLQKADEATAASVLAGAYQKALDKRGVPLDLSVVHQEAAMEATLILRRTQSSPLFKDLSLALSRGGLTGNRSIDKALLQFQAFMLNRWSRMRHDLLTLELRDDPKKAVGTVMWLAMAVVFENKIRWGTKYALGAVLSGMDLAVKEALYPPDDELQRGFVVQVLQNVPFVGQALSSALYEGSPIPALEVLKTGGEGLRNVAMGRKAMTKIRGVVGILEAMGGAAGIPGTSQAAQLVKMAMRDRTIIFPFRRELADLEESEKDGPLVSDERDRLVKLRKFRAVFDAGNTRYRRALALGDMDAAHKSAEEIMEQMKEAR